VFHLLDVGNDLVDGEFLRRLRDEKVLLGEISSRRKLPPEILVCGTTVVAISIESP
jgi:hypothetical protein